MYGTRLFGAKEEGVQSELSRPEVNPVLDAYFNTFNKQCQTLGFPSKAKPYFVETGNMELILESIEKISDADSNMYHLCTAVIAHQRHTGRVPKRNIADIFNGNGIGDPVKRAVTVKRFTGSLIDLQRRCGKRRAISMMTLK